MTAVFVGLAPHFASYVYFNEMWPSEYSGSTLPMSRVIPSRSDKIDCSQLIDLLVVAALSKQSVL